MTSTLPDRLRELATLLDQHDLRTITGVHVGHDERLDVQVPSPDLPAWVAALQLPERAWVPAFAEDPDDPAWVTVRYEPDDLPTGPVSRLVSVRCIKSSAPSA